MTYCAHKKWQTMRTRDVAKALGVTGGSIRRWRRELGLSSHEEKQAHLTKAVASLLADPDAQPPMCTVSISELSRRHKISSCKINKTLKEAGVSPKTNPVNPESRWHTRRRPLGKRIRWTCKHLNEWSRPEGMHEHIGELREAVRRNKVHTN